MGLDTIDVLVDDRFKESIQGTITDWFVTMRTFGLHIHEETVGFIGYFIAFTKQSCNNIPEHLSSLRVHLPQIYSMIFGLCIVCTLFLLIGTTLRIKTLVESYKCGRPNPETSQFFDVFDLAKTAYEKGHAEAVMKEIKRRSLDVNICVPNQGITLFMCACLSGQRRLIQYMIEKGGNPNSTTSDGDGPLYLATYGILNSPQPDFYAIDALIKAGCSVNQSNHRGYTPLHRAASKGHPALVKYLLKKGADPYRCTISGIYPIDSAVNAGHIDVAESLQIEVVNPHVWDVIEPHTPVHISLGLRSPRRGELAQSPLPKLRNPLL